MNAGSTASADPSIGQGNAEGGTIDPAMLQRECEVWARTAAELDAICADLDRMRQQMAAFVAKSWWRRLLEPL